MVPDIKITLMGVVWAAATNIAVESLWYAPPVFGRAWVKLMGWSPKDLERRKQQHLARAYGAMLAAALVLAYFLAHLVEYMGATTALQGAHVGFWVWLGFVATTSLGLYLFEGRPLRLYLLHTGGHLAALAAMGAVLAVV